MVMMTSYFYAAREKFYIKYYYDTAVAADYKRNYKFKYYSYYVKNSENFLNSLVRSYCCT
jgi:hypothetical protein